MPELTCYGLVDSTKRTPQLTPRDRKPDLRLETARRCYDSLAELVRKNERQQCVWPGSPDPLGLYLDHWLPEPPPGLSPAEYRSMCPFGSIFIPWAEARPAEMRDPDGLELIRAMAVGDPDQDYRSSLSGRQKALAERLYGAAGNGRGCLQTAFRWLTVIDPPRDPGKAVERILDAAETVYALVLAEARRDPETGEWHSPYTVFYHWVEVARYSRELLRSGWTEEHHRRYWQLLRFLDEPAPGMARHRPELEDVLGCFEAGAASEDDLIEHLIGPRFDVNDHYSDLEKVVTGPEDAVRKKLARLPKCADALSRLLAALVELERAGRIQERELTDRLLEHAQRTEEPLGLLMRSLKMLDVDGVRSEYAWGSSADGPSPLRPYVWLVRWWHPKDRPDAARFQAAVRDVGLSREVLETTGLANLDVVDLIEAVLGETGLVNACAFCAAHAVSFKLELLGRQHHLKAQTRDRTDISETLRSQGAFDLKWFREARAGLGEARFDALVAHAECFGNEGRRLQLCVKAALGREKKPKLIERMLKSRSQSAVVALGLLPLPEAAAARKAEILDRMRTLREFRTAQKDRKTGPERRRNEQIAYEAGVYNLARHAGYDDPAQLEWMVEIEEGSALADGIEPVKAGDTVLALAVGDGGSEGGCGVELTVTKGGRRLKSVPPALKKLPAAKALIEKHKELSAKADLFSRALEDYMVAVRRFSGADLQDLHRHPLLAPVLSRIVFAGPAATGWPVKGGKALETVDGKLEPVGRADTLRIVHPAELLAAGTLREWQRHCFRRERIEPFKQLFRELYVATEKEKAGDGSVRYSGLRIKGAQGSALLGGRGWLVDEGTFRKVFRSAGVAADLGLVDPTHTPFHMESLTLTQVRFFRVGDDGGLLRPGSVPPVVFSEALRDIDLAVSVAHLPEAPQEASESAIAVRAVLIEEVCTALGLKNVLVKERQARIKGSLAAYTVHLGSGVVHMLPSRQISLAPAAKRPGLMLPFAGGDSATEEIVSKILLFAEDGKIKDSELLRQIR